MEFEVRELMHNHRHAFRPFFVKVGDQGLVNLQCQIHASNMPEPVNSVLALRVREPLDGEDARSNHMNLLLAANKLQD